MQVVLDVPDYDSNTGFIYNWQTGFKIRIGVENHQVSLLANKEGLISLANHLLNLAQEGVQPGTHIHLDEYNSLEPSSNELVIEKVA